MWGLLATVYGRIIIHWCAVMRTVCTGPVSSSMQLASCVRGRHASRRTRAFAAELNLALCEELDNMPTNMLEALLPHGLDIAALITTPSVDGASEQQPTHQVRCPPLDPLWCGPKYLFSRQSYEKAEKFRGVG